VPRQSLDLSVEFPRARRLWRVAPSDGTGLAMMAHGSVGTGRAGAALGTPFSDMVGRLRWRVALASYFSWGVRSGVAISHHPMAPSPMGADSMVGAPGWRPADGKVLRHFSTRRLRVELDHVHAERTTP
jgi:hypothetical protein